MKQWDTLEASERKNMFVGGIGGLRMERMLGNFVRHVKHASG